MRSLYPDQNRYLDAMDSGNCLKIRDILFQKEMNGNT